MSYKIAVASSDGKYVDTHFGHAESFLIYEVNEKDDSYELVEERQSFAACGAQTECNTDSVDDPMDEAAKRLSDVQYLLVSRIGPHAIKALNRYQVTAFSIVLPIDEAIQKITAYRKRQRKILDRLDKEGTPYSS